MKTHGHSRNSNKIHFLPNLKINLTKVSQIHKQHTNPSRIKAIKSKIEIYRTKERWHDGPSFWRWWKRVSRMHFWTSNEELFGRLFGWGSEVDGGSDVGRMLLLCVGDGGVVVDAKVTRGRWIGEARRWCGRRRWLGLDVAVVSRVETQRRFAGEDGVWMGRVTESETEKVEVWLGFEWWFVLWRLKVNGGGRRVYGGVRRQSGKAPQLFSFSFLIKRSEREERFVRIFREWRRVVGRYRDLQWLWGKREGSSREGWVIGEDYLFLFIFFLSFSERSDGTSWKF